MALTFVHIGLTSWSSKPLWAIARKRSGCIYANAIMFARWSLIAFVNIFSTIDTFIARCTWACIRSIHRTCITNGIRMAWIWCTSIIQMAQKTRFAWYAAAIKAANTINTGSTVKTSRISAIVNIFTAIRSCPSINAYTWITANRVCTCCTILAYRRSSTRQCWALVNVILTKFARIIWWTFATIRIHTINTLSTVLTKISGAIVYILFTIDALEACVWKK